MMNARTHTHTQQHPMLLGIIASHYIIQEWRSIIIIHSAFSFAGIQMIYFVCEGAVVSLLRSNILICTCTCICIIAATFTLVAIWLDAHFGWFMVQHLCADVVHRYHAIFYNWSENFMQTVLTWKRFIWINKSQVEWADFISEISDWSVNRIFFLWNL